MVSVPECGLECSLGVCPPEGCRQSCSIGNHGVKLPEGKFFHPSPFSQRSVQLWLSVQRNIKKPIRFHPGLQNALGMEMTAPLTSPFDHTAGPGGGCYEL